MEGPEIDGHKVDWDLLVERMRSYLHDETSALDLWIGRIGAVPERKASLSSRSN